MHPLRNARLPRRLLAAALAALAFVLAPVAGTAKVRTVARPDTPRAGTHAANEIRAGFLETVIADSLDSPVSMAIAPDGRVFVDLLAACLEAAQAGRAVFPISSTIYVEASKIRAHRQRRDLREIVERLSHYAVVTSRPVIMAHEVEALLDRLIGPNPSPINTMDYLDWGVARAFGLVGGFTVATPEGEDLAAEARSTYTEGPRAFDVLLGKAEWDLNQRMIEGPLPDVNVGPKGEHWSAEKVNTVT